MDALNLDVCRVRFVFDRSLSTKVSAKDLRGAVASFYKEDPLFHQHTEENHLIYNYPLIQYKVLRGQGIVVGIGAGSAALAQVDLLGRDMRMGWEEYRVEEQEFYFAKTSFGVCEQLRLYEFVVPWLGLNTRNYQTYVRTGMPEKRNDLLEKILIGNVISMSKGLGYNVPHKLSARIIKARETDVVLKGAPMLGFWGKFSINFSIPEYFGLGKSVSRGFGTLIRADRS